MLASLAGFNFNKSYKNIPSFKKMPSFKKKPLNDYLLLETLVLCLDSCTAAETYWDGMTRTI